jgi:hypothetical protein
MRCDIVHWLRRTGSARTREPGRWSKWSSARPETRGGWCRKVREEKGKKKRELLKKWRGMNASLYLADKVGSDAVRRSEP